MLLLKFGVPVNTKVGQALPVSQSNTTNSGQSHVDSVSIRLIEIVRVEYVNN